MNIKPDQPDKPDKPDKPDDSSHFVGGTSGAKDREQEGKKSRREEGLRIEGLRGKD